MILFVMGFHSPTDNRSIKEIAKNTKKDWSHWLIILLQIATLGMVALDYFKDL